MYDQKQRGHKLTERHLPFSMIAGREEGDVVWECIEEIASGEEVLLHLGTSPEMPFWFRTTSWSPSERSLSSDHWWDHSSTPKDTRCYCIQVRVMLGDGGGNWPPPTHAWVGCFIFDILHEAWPEDQITETMVLSPGEAILFFGQCSRNEGLPYCRARNIEFGMGGLFNWAGRPTQIEALRKTVQEGCHTINEAVVEKKMKARGPGQPTHKGKAPQDSSCSLWHQGVDMRLGGSLQWGTKMEWQYEPRSWSTECPLTVG